MFYCYFFTSKRLKRLGWNLEQGQILIVNNTTTVLVPMASWAKPLAAAGLF